MSTTLLCAIIITIAASMAIALEPQSSLVFVPGDGASKLEARLNKSSRVHYICSLQSDWFDVWLNLKLLTPLEIDCFVDNMRLIYDTINRKAEMPPGVHVRPYKFGSIESVDYIDSNHLPKTDYFTTIIDEVESVNGYTRDSDMVASPYDFRLGPNQLGSFFTNLTILIEETFEKNDNRQVSVICHSMGCNLMVNLLNKKSKSWKNKYVQRIISIAAPWAGSVKALNAILFGDNLGLFIISSAKLNLIQKTSPSLTYLFPVAPTFPSDRVLIESEHKNYTIDNMREFFRDIDYSNGYMMWQDTKGYAESIKAPEVEVWCLYSIGVPTISEIKFTGSFPDSKHREIFGDGDGTVNIESLRVCREWVYQQKEPVHVHEFTALDHVALLRSSILAQFVSKHILNQS